MPRETSLPKREYIYSTTIVSLMLCFKNDHPDTSQCPKQQLRECSPQKRATGHFTIYNHSPWLQRIQEMRSRPSAWWEDGLPQRRISGNSEGSCSVFPRKSIHNCETLFVERWYIQQGPKTEQQQSGCRHPHHGLWCPPLQWECLLLMKSYPPPPGFTMSAECIRQPPQIGWLWEVTNRMYILKG